MRRWLSARTRKFSSLAENSPKQSEQSARIEAEDGPPLELRTGHMARFTTGSCVASRGDNAVLATCVAKFKQPGPLTVDYRRSAAAVGRIPTNFLRREMSQSDHEILLSRAVDRSLRPLLPTTCHETQIVCKPLSLDEDADELMLGLNAAATALHLSEVPFCGPLAAVRVVVDANGNVLVNPGRKRQRDQMLNMILATKEAERTVMIELEGKQVSLEMVDNALTVGFHSVEAVLREMERLRKTAGKPKIELEPEDKKSSELEKIVETLAVERIYYVLTDYSHDKLSRDNALSEILNDVLASDKLVNVEGPIGSIYYALVKDTLRNLTIFGSLHHPHLLTSEVFRNLILDVGMRCDGRKPTEFRPLSMSTNMFARLHGCSLFQRGQTQVMSTVTFDSPNAAFHPDSIAQLLGSQRKKTFMLHYEFPSFAVNELGQSRTSNRREIGHGALAEKALKGLLPDDFPYAVRLACQVFESNGSSSMASVCGGSLALMDAGVPLKAAAAGVAVGLITDPAKPDEKFKVLTDLVGIEDYAGDMDFKIAGTANGFTAMQMDVKIAGLSRQQLHLALEAGKEGIDFMLAKMNVVCDRPRESFKSSVPIVETIRIEPHKRALLFRNSGYNCKHVESETGVKISAEEENNLLLFAPNKQAMEAAKEAIGKLVSDAVTSNYTFGQIISVQVYEVLEKGINVLLPGGGRPVFIKNAQLSLTPIKDASVLGLNVGDAVPVQWLGRDEQTGAIRLVRRALAATGASRKPA